MNERVEFLTDVFTCIVEDFGYNSWRQIERYDIDTSTATIVVCDEYEQFSDDSEVFNINLETVVDGLGKIGSRDMKINGSMAQLINEANANNDAGQLDVFDADAILQVAIFDELVYG